MVLGTFHFWSFVGPNRDLSYYLFFRCIIIKEFINVSCDIVFGDIVDGGTVLYVGPFEVFVKGLVGVL